jgi:hypothetical protein
VLLLVFLEQLSAAQAKPFCYDELMTVYVSSLRAPSLIRNALSMGIDAMPLLYYFVTGQISRLPLDPHIAFRLLSIFGYLMGMLGIYAFVGRRYGPTMGLAAALLLALSPFEYYATEARPYAVLVGLIAVAAAIWQRIDEQRWLAL